MRFSEREGGFTQSASQTDKVGDDGSPALPPGLTLLLSSLATPGNPRSVPPPPRQTPLTRVNALMELLCWALHLFTRLAPPTIRL